LDKKEVNQKTSHLFANLFGDFTLDVCSPNFCSFSFDIFGYDERICNKDIYETKKWNEIRKKRKNGDSEEKTKTIDVNWDELEHSPGAEEDEEDREWKYQTFHFVDDIRAGISAVGVETRNSFKRIEEFLTGKQSPVVSPNTIKQMKKVQIQTGKERQVIQQKKRKGIYSPKDEDVLMVVEKEKDGKVVDGNENKNNKDKDDGGNEDVDDFDLSVDKIKKRFSLSD